MGVTISSVNKSINLGYYGFDRLRNKIATLINDEIAEHYKKWSESTAIFDDKKIEEFFKEYNAETERLDKKYDYKYNNVLHFLYACYYEATMSVDVCEKLYDIIKDYDDNNKYGYAGRKDCATFKDFKELVKDCIDNNGEMQWF